MDSESTVTSLDDQNTENLCDNPTRDTLADGFISLFKPVVDQLDERVRATRIAQLELKQQLENLLTEIKAIEKTQQTPINLDSYVKKLINVKHKVTVVSNVLQGSQDRLNRIHLQINREQLKRKALLDSELSTSAAYLNKNASTSQTTDPGEEP